MSEVERYWIDPNRLVQEGWHQDDTCVVKDWAYDRVVAERDAALAQLEESQVDCEANKHEREVVCANYEVLLQDLNQRDEQIATLDLQREAHLRNSQAAERRVGVLEGLLRNIWHVVPNGYKSEIDAALKPAEGSTCNQVREESGLPVNTPCQACGRGACIDR